ncbi:miz zinc finger protein [Diplodia corticola]|uniref:Miz zinc finger protein n=1 Tax=Diplodia corticola TaxID=236234 RepID=A0A1J9R4E9_9PEZI|nr:miz zinc finger protein [Diplodia corticola]OJD35480.1 miz zinc finger protein [Diplodia corticola]
MRPRDPALREHQTSNSTANAFLGGRRMPSWLTTSQPQVNASPLVPSRKRPAPRDLDAPRRPSKPVSSSASPTLPCATAASVAPQAPAVAAHNASSNPASPALPNVVASHMSRATTAAAENSILPSPAPSEDPAVHPPAPNKDPAMNRARATSIVSLGDEEDDEDGSRTDNRLDVGVAPAPSRSMSLASAENNTRAMQTSLEQADGVANPSREEALRRPSAPESASLQAPEANASAQTDHVAVEHAQAAAAQDPQPHLTSHRRATSCLAAELCMKRLQALIPLSADGRGLSAVETVRVDLVREAVERGDHDYIHFHQLMCLRASASRLPITIAQNNLALTSLDLLNHLVQTREVTMPWLQRFADFPVPIHVMQQQWPDDYMKQISVFDEFIARARENGWENMQKLCFVKKLPPTAVEIGRELGMHSPIFQSVFHRAILRRLCDFPEPNTPPQVDFFTRAEAAFRLHQQRLADIPSQSLSMPEHGQRQLNEEMWYREQIINLQRRYLAQTEQANLQSRRMSGQGQSPQLQLMSNSPAQRQGQIRSPAQPSPFAHQASVQIAQQQAVPGQPTPQPSLQVAIPRARSGSSQMSPYGVTTPTSTLQSPRPASSVQNMNRMNFVHQQIQRQSLPNNFQMGMSMNDINLASHGHSPGSQNRSQRQPQSPMTPQYPPSGIQPMNGQMVRPGMLAGVYQQQIYQQGVPLPNDAQGGHRQIQAHQVVRSNAASPGSASVTRHVVHQVDPRRANGVGRSPVQVQSQMSQPMIPPVHHNWAPHIVDPSQSALHQSHLSSPVLEATPRPELGRKLFQSVIAFAIPPERLKDGAAQQKLTFQITAEDEAHLPPRTEVAPFEINTRKVTEQTRMYRLRCARSASKAEHVWIRQSTCWPEGMFLTLNGQVLEMRKKLQHTKDLPIDITPYLRRGENGIEISLLRRPDEEKMSNYLVAIEVVGIHHYDKIKTDCLSQRLVPAAEVLGSIKGTLSGSADDDEIAIVGSNVAISLFDPMTKCRHCDIPVRGRWCLHRECFDLDVFLNTRRRSQKRPDSPSSVDDWKCLVCNGDARPESLVVDGFLMQVITELSAAGQSETSAIIVDSDGKWKAKPEDDTRASQTRTSHASTPVLREPSAPSAVIELE